MRFPIQTPAPGIDAGARPVRVRASALAVVAALVASAALAVPAAAHAEEQPEVQEAVAAEAPAPVAVEEPAPDAADVPVEQPPAAVVEPVSAPVEDADPVAEDSSAWESEAEESAPVEKSSGAASGAQALAGPVEPAEAGAGEPVNQLPVATDDHYQMVQDTTLTVDSPGFRINDYDPEGDWFGVQKIEPYLPSELTAQHDGGFVFTPPAGFTGTRVFTYWLRTDDGDLSAPGTITIEVLPTGSEVDLPPIVDDEKYFYLFNTPLYIAAPGVLANDIDPDGDELSISLLVGPLQGALELNPDGSFLYTPKEGFGGVHWFRYRVCDASNCADGETTLEPISVGGTPSGPSEPPAGEEPGEPAQPGEPAEPGEPIEPVHPTEPVEPTEPIEPGRPAEEQTPLDENEPSDPAVRTETVTSDAAALAETGTDASPYTALAALLVAIGIALRLRRRAADH